MSYRNANAKYLLLGVLVFYSLSSVCQQTKQTKSKKDTVYCIYNLKRYKDYWLQDSLAKNGFREIFASKVLTECPFEGIKWSTISEYFGKPDWSYPHSNEKRILYRYRLNHYMDDIHVPGTMLLDIDVRNDLIVGFYVYSID